MRPGVALANEQEDLKRVMLNTAYASLKDKETIAEVIDRLVAINKDSDTPLEFYEIEGIVTEAVNTRKSKITTKEKDDTIYTSFIETPEYLIEEVNATLATHATHKLNIKYIVFNKDTCSVEEKDEFNISNQLYKPIASELVTKQGAISLPSGVEDYESTGKLIEEIDEFLTQYIELPLMWKTILPYIILFYWVYDKFPFIPYLHFVGLTGTGKTTAAEVVGSICYKPIDASGSLTLSPIFRLASEWGGTLMLDEFEPDGEGYKDMLTFLKGTVSNKAILKTEGENKREVVAFLAKCPKIFTSENPINNAGLQSRTLVIKMEKNKRRVPLYRLGKFKEQALHLRNKLLLWRLHHYDKINLDEIEYGYPELSTFDGRVQQVITPIFYFSDEKTREKVIEFARIQETETLRERRESLEGQIFQVIKESYPEPVTLGLITGKINFGRSQRNQVTEKRVGNIIRKVFGFEIERRGHDNTSTVVLDGQQKRIEEISESFYPQTSVASVAQVAINTSDDTDAIIDATHSFEE